MVSVTTRILTIALAFYSYLQVSVKAAENVPGAHAADAAKLMFGVQILVSVIFFLIPFFPETVHFGSRTLADYTPAQMERIMPLLRDMTGVMGFVAALYFAVNVRLLIRQLLSPDPREAARAIAANQPWLVCALLVGEGVTVYYYLRRFDAAANSASTNKNCS